MPGAKGGKIKQLQAAGAADQPLVTNGSGGVKVGAFPSGAAVASFDPPPAILAAQVKGRQASPARYELRTDDAVKTQAIGGFSVRDGEAFVARVDISAANDDGSQRAAWVADQLLIGRTGDVIAITHSGSIVDETPDQSIGAASAWEASIEVDNDAGRVIFSGKGGAGADVRWSFTLTYSEA